MSKSAFKGVIYDHGQHMIGSDRVYKYLVSGVIITDKPIEVSSEDSWHAVKGELVNVHECFNKLQKVKLEYPMGDISIAVTELKRI